MIEKDFDAITKDDIDALVRDSVPEGRSTKTPSVVSHKRLELFSLSFSHSGAGASGLDSLQRLFAAVQLLDN